SSTIGGTGDRLPYSSRWSANLAAEQAFPIRSQAEAFVRGTVIYAGDRKSAFSQTITQPRVTLPSFVQPNLIAGVRYGPWSFNCFANNVTDRRGIVSRVSTGPTSSQLGYVYIQPRTVGLSVARSF